MPFDRENSQQPVSVSETPQHSANDAIKDGAMASMHGNAVPVLHNSAEPAVDPASTSPHPENCNEHDGVAVSPHETAHPSSAEESETPADEPSDGEPFFADENAFLTAVFEDWTYWVKVLGGKYSSLVEQEREIGNDAPVGAWWHVPVKVPRSKRDFKTTIGSCDAQDIIVGAIQRCINPNNKSHYTNYPPEGSRVSFRTWFVNNLRSVAGSRVRSWTRKPWQETHILGQKRSSDDRPERFTLVDTFMRPKRLRVSQTSKSRDNNIEAAVTDSKVLVHTGDTVEAFLVRGGHISRIPAFPARNFSADPQVAYDEEMCQWQLRQHADKKRTKRKDPGHHSSYSAIEARLDLKKLSVCLTKEEKNFLDTLIEYGGCASEEFAEGIGYEYDQARSKASYIRKKMTSFLKNTKN